MSTLIGSIDHVQIAAPEGSESAAREFYGQTLGMEEIEKPEALRVRGGCWFRCGQQQLHIGIERDFKPAKKAHPAFTVSDLPALRERLLACGVLVIEDDSLPGTPRFFSHDPCGNRLEFVCSRARS